MKESVFQSGMLSIISQATAAITNLRLYSHQHSMVSEHLGKAYRELSHILDLKDSVTLFTVDNELILDNRSLFSSGQTVERFVRVIREKGVERITFLKGLSWGELQAFIGDLASRETAAVRSWPFIKLGYVEIRVKSQAAQASRSDQPSRSGEAGDGVSFLSTMDERDIERIRDLYLLAQERKQISIRDVDDVIRKLIFEIQMNVTPLSLLATVKCNDEYTFTHVVNVCILTLIQAQKLGFQGKQLYDIGMAALLHDVGKNFIPEEILSKPGRLTAEERAVIETHPVKGGRYLMEVGDVPKIAILAAMEHHLRFDGSGYPAIKPGWKPNIVAQLITIADVFDALRSRRSYSAPKPMDKVVGILNEEKGTTFNPILVESFLEIVAPELTLSHFPEKGEAGIVVAGAPLNRPPPPQTCPLTP